MVTVSVNMSSYVPLISTFDFKVDIEVTVDRLNMVKMVDKVYVDMVDKMDIDPVGPS